MGRERRDACATKGTKMNLELVTTAAGDKAHVRVSERRTLCDSDRNQNLIATDKPLCKHCANMMRDGKYPR